MYNMTERMNELFLSLGIGEFSLQKYLLLVAVSVFVMTMIPVLIATLRGAGKHVAFSAARDVLVGVACAISVFTFPGFFFFVGRGYITALTADEAGAPA